MKNVKIQRPEEKVVTVYTTTDPVRSSLVSNMLIDHGINAQEAGGRQAGFTGTLPIEIIVRECDAAAAAEFIKVHFPEG